MLQITRKYGKSLLSGGVAGLVHITGLFLLHEFAGMHYLVSSGISFLFAIVVNYLLQKKWVFESTGENKTHLEFFLFLTLTGIYLLLNTWLLYLSVRYLNINYLISQTSIIILLSILNFYVYGKIFQKSI